MGENLLLIIIGAAAGIAAIFTTMAITGVEMVYKEKK